jgi:hypothetical protein
MAAASRSIKAHTGAGPREEDGERLRLEYEHAHARSARPAGQRDTRSGNRYCCQAFSTAAIGISDIMPVSSLPAKAERHSHQGPVG